MLWMQIALQLISSCTTQKKNLYDGREGYEMRLEITTLYIYILGQIDNIMGRD
jgi:hypothetical protein